MKHLFAIVFCVGCLLSATAQTAPDSLRLQQRFQQAQQLIAAYQFDKAQQLLSECYVKDPQNVDYLLRIAYCHSQLGRYPDAKMFYGEVLKVDSSNAVALSSLGGLYEQEYNYRKARDYFETLIAIDSTNSFYHKRNGYLALRLGDALGGLSAFLKAHQLNEADIETISQLASIYLAMEALDYAEQMLEKGRRIDPRNIKLLQAKARLHSKRKEHPAVVDAIENTMAQGDTSEYYQMMLGVAYLQIDSVERALFHLQDIVRRREDTEHTHHYLGLAYRTLGALDKAAEHFDKAVKKGISEKMGVYYSGLAGVYEEKGALKEAIRYYEEALRYEKQPETIFYLARNCDQYYKDKKIALRYYQQYLDSGDGKYREYTEQRIQQLREYLHFRQ